MAKRILTDNNTEYVYDVDGHSEDDNKEVVCGGDDDDDTAGMYVYGNVDGGSDGYVDDDVEDGRDSREESESLHYEKEKRYILAEPCKKCKKLWKTRLMKNNNNYNQSNNNNNNDDGDDDDDDDVSDNDIDSIENSFGAYNYPGMRGKETDQCGDEGLMFFKNYKYKRVYNKIDYKSAINKDQHNHNQNNSIRNGFVPGKFVKSKENVLKEGKSIPNFDKRPPTRGKMERTEKELEKLDESRRMEDAKKESVRHMKIQQQFKQQQQQQQKELHEKQALKLNHLKRLSRVRAEESDLDIIMEKEGEDELMELKESPQLPVCRTSELQAPPESASKEDMVMSHDIVNDDSKTELMVHGTKLLGDDVYRELRRKLSSFTGQARQSSQGDACQKQPSNPFPTPNLSPEPSDIQRYYINPHEITESEEGMSDLGDKYYSSLNNHYDSDSRNSLYGLSVIKNVFVAAMIVLLSILWMVDLCPESMVR